MKTFLISLFLLWFSTAGAAAPPDFQEAARRYEGLRPSAWGAHIPGVIGSFTPRGKELALTLDACGGRRGSGYDARLMDYLRVHRIPATLFISARWALSNPLIFIRLARDPLFEIGNHGLLHRPCAVTPRSVYNIAATGSAAETLREIAESERILMDLGAPRPRFFRSGTAYYDDVSIRIAGDLGYRVAGFTKAADGGATFKASLVYRNVTASKAGSILLLHFNQPQSETRKGLTAALEHLRARGWRFLRLSDALDPRRR